MFFCLPSYDYEALRSSQTCGVSISAKFKGSSAGAVWEHGVQWGWQAPRVRLLADFLAKAVNAYVWMLGFWAVFGRYLYWIFQNGFLLQVVDLESVMNMSHVRRFSTSLFLGRFFEWTCSANVTQKLEVFASFPLLFVWYGNVPVDFASRQWFLDFWTEWQWYKSWHQSAFCWNHLSKL